MSLLTLPLLACSLLLAQAGAAAPADQQLRVVNNSDKPVRVLLALSPGTKPSDWTDERLEPGKETSFKVKMRTSYVFRLYRYEGPSVQDMGFNHYSFDPPEDAEAGKLYRSELVLDHWATWDATNPAQKVKRTFDPPETVTFPVEWQPGQFTVYLAERPKDDAPAERSSQDLRTSR